MQYEIMGVKAFKAPNMITQVLKEGDGSLNKKKDISRMVVEIIFRRRIEYHVTNTFLQVTELNS